MALSFITETDYTDATATQLAPAPDTPDGVTRECFRNLVQTAEDQSDPVAALQELHAWLYALVPAANRGSNGRLKLLRGKISDAMAAAA